MINMSHTHTTACTHEPSRLRTWGNWIFTKVPVLAGIAGLIHLCVHGVCLTLGVPCP